MYFEELLFYQTDASIIICTTNTGSFNRVHLFTCKLNKLLDLSTFGTLVNKGTQTANAAHQWKNTDTKQNMKQVLSKVIIYCAGVLF